MLKYDINLDDESKVECKKQMVDELYAKVKISEIDYVLEGSVSRGNIADIPWLCIYDKDITIKAGNGFYIVYLFSPDMKTIYLSLNLAWTQFEDYAKENNLRPITKKAIANIQSNVENAQKLLHTISRFNLSKMDLNSSSGLAPGYEAGSICYLEYNTSDMPSEEELINDINDFLIAYSELKKLVGTSALDIKNIAIESSYQDMIQNVNETLVLAPGMIPRDEPIGSGKGSNSRWPRKPEIAAQALKSAYHMCEYDNGHITFIHKKTKNQYVEAHHLIPMKYQGL